MQEEFVGVRVERFFHGKFFPEPGYLLPDPNDPVYLPGFNDAGYLTVKLLRIPSGLQNVGEDECSFRMLLLLSQKIQSNPQ